MTCIWSINKLEAEPVGFPAVFFVTLGLRGDETRLWWFCCLVATACGCLEEERMF